MDFVQALTQVADASGEVVRSAAPPPHALPPGAATRVVPAALPQNQATVPSAEPPASPSLLLGRTARTLRSLTPPARGPPAPRGSAAPAAAVGGCRAGLPLPVLRRPHALRLPLDRPGRGRPRAPGPLLPQRRRQSPRTACTRLQNLRHPALPDREVFWSAAGLPGGRHRHGPADAARPVRRVPRRGPARRPARAAAAMPGAAWPRPWTS